MFLGKVIISGTIELKTGLHIGASKETMKIGGIDSPVIRDAITDFPYIPGSSLKGKLRSLWERAYESVWAKTKQTNEKFYTEKYEIKRHECENEYAKECLVCRIFGTANGNLPSRIIVRDLHLTQKSKENLEKIDTGLKYTEWKFENVIDRITSQATPRQIERIPAGSVFEFEIIYNIENKDHAEEDLKNIQKCLDLLKDDYLGGQGSRGYGKVEVKYADESKLKVVVKTTKYYLTKEDNAMKECDKLQDAIEFIKQFYKNKECT